MYELMPMGQQYLSKKKDSWSNWLTLDVKLVGSCWKRKAKEVWCSFLGVRFMSYYYSSSTEFNIIIIFMVIMLRTGQCGALL